MLHVCVSGPLTDGSEATITGTGRNVQHDDSGLVSFSLFLFAVGTPLLPCATDYDAELTLAANNPQINNLTFAGFTEGDPNGPFTVTTYVPVHGTGQLRFCGYSTFVTDTAAWATTDVTLA